MFSRSNVSRRLALPILHNLIATVVWLFICTAGVAALSLIFEMAGACPADVVETVERGEGALLIGRIDESYAIAVDAAGLRPNCKCVKELLAEVSARKAMSIDAAISLEARDELLRDCRTLALEANKGFFSRPRMTALADKCRAEVALSQLATDSKTTPPSSADGTTRKPKERQKAATLAVGCASDQKH